MKVDEMTKEDFEKVPYREHWNSTEKPFYSLVIIPTGEMHDSGWMMMDFVSVDRSGEPIARLSGCSDVLDLGGIGGYGNWKGGEFPRAIRPVAWHLDCLPKTGYIRLLCNEEMICDSALSNFEVFTENPVNMTDKRDVAKTPEKDKRARFGMGYEYHDWICPVCGKFLAYEPSPENIPHRCGECGQLLESLL